jgi:hypothetical protein
MVVHDVEHDGQAAAVAQRCGKLKPMSYDLRDEGTYTTGACNPFDFDFSAVSLAAFRQWLKAKYGTLEALNASWETAYKAWDEVTPLMTDEIQAREFKRMAQANFTPWADHREYNDDTFTAAVARYRDEIHRHDAGAPVGFSGSQMPSAYGGFDYWKVCNTVSWIEHYDICGSREVIASLLPRRYPSIRGTFFNGVQKDAGIEARKMWSYALHGDSGGLVWPYDDKTKTATGELKNMFIDLDGAKLTKEGEALGRIFQDLRGGVPCLLRHAQAQTPPVAILYSQASLRADWPLEVKRDGKTWCNRYGSYETSHNYYAAGREGYGRLIEDLGLQFTYLASAQVESGELLKRGIRLLLVPRGLALSKKESAAMQSFVEQGGVLVTDLMAGRMNENCRVWPESPGPLDALLGLTRAPFAFEEETKEDDETKGYKGGFGRAIDITLAEDFGSLKKGEKFAVQGFQEPGLKAGTARALGTSATGPVILENKIGKGFAYTLNFDLPNYLEQRAQPKATELTAPARRLFLAFARQANVQPPAQVSRKGGAEHPVGIETFHYTLGAAEFFAFHVNASVRIEIDLSDSGQGVAALGTEPLVIKFPRKAFVTEMRSGRSFGQTDTVEMAPEKDRPLVFSLLPYELKILTVGSGKISDGRLPLSVSIQTSAAAEDHVVHAEFVDKAGAVVPESVVNLPLVKGAYTGAIDCSFVPGDGPWTLRLRDVASGKTVELNVSK